MYMFAAIIAIARPRHWVKNLALFAPLFFAGRIFDVRSVWTVAIGFLAFCLLSSSSYIFNDILDVELDRLHPFKRERPIAKGTIPMPVALVLAIFTGTLGLTMSYFLSGGFGSI